VSRLRALGAVGLAAMVAADVVLVVLAVRHTRSVTPALSDVVATPGPTASESPTRETEPGSTPTGSPVATSRAGPDPDAPRVLVDIGADNAVARAATGICGRGGATIELSRDGGATFERARVPDAAVVLRIASVDVDTAWAIAADRECATLTTFTTSDGGGTWTRADGSYGSWHRLPGRRRSGIHAPTGDVDVPCPRGQAVHGYSTLSTRQAYVLCGGEGAPVVLRTLDGGAAWSERGEVTGALDLDFVSASDGLAAVMGDRSCAGIAVHASTDAGASWKPRACVETETGEFPDITADGDRAYVGAGESLWFSDDAGLTWAARSG
jgi:hypothetical protein